MSSSEIEQEIQEANAPTPRFQGPQLGDLVLSGQLLERYALEALKVFMPRALDREDESEWVTLLEGLAEVERG